MNQEIKATTQYGDFKGTVAIDQFEGVDLLSRLAGKVKLASGYIPVGFSLNATAKKARDGGHRYSLSIFATRMPKDKNAQEGDKKHQAIRVREFRTTIELLEVANIFSDSVKRFCIVGSSKRTSTKSMIRIGPE